MTQRTDMYDSLKMDLHVHAQVIRIIDCFRALHTK